MSFRAYLESRASRRPAHEAIIRHGRIGATEPYGGKGHKKRFISEVRGT
ncbi:hypothetical protein HMPREF3036_01650, partial [Sutterella sp. KLE1602]